MFIAYVSLDKGESLLMLGLSRENRDRLEEGQPISLERATHGMAIPAGLKVLIFAGETEASMKEQMRQMIGPTTVVDQKKPQ